MKNEESDNKIEDTMITMADRSWFIPVDEWVPEDQDIIFKNVNKAVILPVSSYYGIPTSTDLDYFILSPKRCYNSPDRRQHTCHYLNYFTKYYDMDKELLISYFHLKYIIDFRMEYNVFNFLNDLKKYIFHNKSLLHKAYLMNEDNYCIPLGSKKGRSVASLQYTTKHGKILMQISLLINMVIPLATHFAYVKNVDNIDGFLLEIYDIIFSLTDVDMYNKLYETAANITKRNASVHSPLWNKQNIRGINITTHTRSSVENIILNVIPKYVYVKNIISLNYVSIRNNTGYKITDIAYEFNYRPLFSSNRDEDFVSDFDKFESYLIRQDEALYLQNKVACEETMLEIERQFGPFERQEIDFYTEALEEDGSNVINKFQKELIFNLFYKYFGDPESISAINRDDYIKLMIAAKRILLAYNMVMFPYIITGKITRMAERKYVNKRELTLIKDSPFWAYILEKYQNQKIEDYVLGLMATILSSEFKIIDFHDEELHGKIIDNIPDIVCEELLLYITMI